MTWEDWKTPLYAEGFVVVGAILYAMTAWVVDKLKNSKYPGNVICENGEYKIKIQVESSNNQN